MSHGNQNVAFPVNNLFQQKPSEVIKLAKRLNSTTKSTVKAASFFAY